MMKRHDSRSRRRWPSFRHRHLRRPPKSTLDHHRQRRPVQRLPLPRLSRRPATKPAFQGGFDVAHSSGFYVGNWNSNVEQGLFNGASLEMDFYGGYKGTFGAFGYDVG